MDTFLELWTSLSPAEKAALAKAAETHPTYLSQIAHNHKGRRAGADLIERLMKADNRITFQMMRAKEAA